VSDDDDGDKDRNEKVCLYVSAQFISCCWGLEQVMSEMCCYLDCWNRRCETAKCRAWKGKLYAHVTGKEWSVLLFRM